MGDYGFTFGKLYYLPRHLEESWSIFNHFIGYAGHTCNKVWDAPFGIYQGDEFICYPGAIVNINGNFGDPLPKRASPCGFDVEYSVHLP